MKTWTGRWSAVESAGGFAFVAAESIADRTALLAAVVPQDSPVVFAWTAEGWNGLMDGVAVERGLWFEKDAGMPPTRVRG